MSQGPELAQTLQMPNVLEAEAGLAERAHEVGVRVIDWIQDGAVSLRRKIPAAVLAGLAFTGTSVYEATPAEAATPHATVDRVYRLGCYANGKSDSLAIRFTVTHEKGHWLTSSAAVPNNQPQSYLTNNFKPTTGNWTSTIRYREAFGGQPLIRKGKVAAIANISEKIGHKSIGPKVRNITIPAASKYTCLTWHK